MTSSHNIKEGRRPAAPAERGARFLASPRLLYWLLPALMLLSTAGTLVPQGETPAWYAGRFGPWAGLLTLCRLDDIYHSGLFTFLLGLLGLNLALCTWQRQIHAGARRDVLLTHAAVFTILAGGMITGLAGRRGSLPLNVGQTKDSVEGKPGFTLPFSVKLEDFHIDFYGSGLHRLTITDRKAGWKETAEVQVGAAAALRDGAVRVAALDFFPDFVIDQGGPATRSQLPNNPALRLEITDAQGVEKHWAFARFPSFHADPKSRYEVAYELAPGQVKQFRSEVALLEAGWVAGRRAIEVNKPLRWKGYTLYQAGYDPENPGFSSLLVSRDPGVPVVYAGFLLLTAGLLWTFLRTMRRRP
ncbi:MAG: cytochrome c biogenesis protein ResB [Elusimicrobia bacterium]|nr:cytochrome c biogenesis protein ResB [Elusimicrobiota bacterium]